MIQKILRSSWFMALILLGLFLLVTGYKYGWDDQHLEIPLLKNLIDSSLYSGDYYVESLKQNFSSFFYPILAKLITVEQIPTVYFLLYMISRYFLFFFVFKLWLYISRNKFQAFICVVVFILMARVDEFMYRTFSHQEFALAIIFAGIYYFFKERFILSAVILGIAANFHALYSLFPMLFMSVYLLLSIRKYGIQTLIKTGATFLIFSAPFLGWVIKTRFMAAPDDPGLYVNWIKLYQAACPQNFILPPVDFTLLVENTRVFIRLIEPYLLILVLLLLNFLFNKPFRENKKAVCFALSAVALLVISLIFTYIHPVRFIVDLNLIRNKQYLYFLVMGYTTILAIRKVQGSKPIIGLLITVFFMFLKYPDSIALLSAFVLIFIFAIEQLRTNEKSISNSLFITLFVVAIGASAYEIIHIFNAIPFQFHIRRNLLIIAVLLILTYLSLKKFDGQPQAKWLRACLIIIPLTMFFYQYGSYHVKKLKSEQQGDGFWRLQRSWEDMQRYTKENTETDAMILVPYNMEMGGFRILSERKIVLSYRDCGIIGFDYKAALNWQQRLHDVEAFRYTISESPTRAIQNAIIKYGADYIVFMRYAMPGTRNDLLEKVYTNTDFALFRVRPNPVIQVLQEKAKELAQ